VTVKTNPISSFSASEVAKKELRAGTTTGANEIPATNPYAHSSARARSVQQMQEAAEPAKKPWSGGEAVYREREASHASWWTMVPMRSQSSRYPKVSATLRVSPGRSKRDLSLCSSSEPAERRHGRSSSTSPLTKGTTGSWAECPLLSQPRRVVHRDFHMASTLSVRTRSLSPLERLSQDSTRRDWASVPREHTTAGSIWRRPVRVGAPA